MAQQTYSAMLLQANESNIAGSVQQSGIRQVDSATPPAEPYKPKPALNIAFGTLAGLCLSIGAAFLWEKMDRSVRSPGHSRTLLNVPELGVIPSIASQTPRLVWRLLPGKDHKDAGDSMRPELHFQKASQIRAGEPNSAQLADSFRVTMASLMLGNASGRRPQVILVTSPSPGEGKTTIVGNLGTALAETGRSVLVVDGDFRRPKLHKLFELENTWGLSDILAEGVELPEKLGLETTVPGLMVLPNGKRPASVSKLLYSSQMRRFFQAVRERFDVVLIDAPPILEVADARLLGEFADGALLVLRSGITDRADALQAYQQLFEDRTTLLGTVLNDFKPSRKSRQFYQYYSLQQD